MTVLSLLALLATSQDKLYVAWPMCSFFTTVANVAHTAVQRTTGTYSVPLWIVTFTPSSCLTLFPLAVTCAGAICFM